jgi:hypothetical protein
MKMQYRGRSGLHQKLHFKEQKEIVDKSIKAILEVSLLQVTSVIRASAIFKIKYPVDNEINSLRNVYESTIRLVQMTISSRVISLLDGEEIKIFIEKHFSQSRKNRKFIKQSKI